MEIISNKDRFYRKKVGHTIYAPMTIGTPEFTEQVDYKVFKKSKQEKEEIKIIKLNHKKELRDAYGKIGRNLNVPSKSIGGSIKNIF